ncbi:MAG: hypothetical protein JJE10_02650 [Thermoleophilia bacterium]|nr:hypothetical protein [Thermoleophilia bacterium]
MKTSRPSGRLLDRILIAAAGVYLVWIAAVGAGSGWHATADLVFEGRVWLLLSSSLEITPEFNWAQWILLAGITAAVIYRLGPRIWWTVALTGHVGAALVSYTAIEIATQAGSASARTSAGQTDFGVSIVLAASLGALTASGLTGRRGRNGDLAGTDRATPTRADRAALAVGLLGLAGMAAFSIGWYDIQHLVGYAIGFFLTRYLVDHNVRGIGREGSGSG